LRCNLLVFLQEHVLYLLEEDAQRHVLSVTAFSPSYPIKGWKKCAVCCTRLYGQEATHQTKSF
jgi:hypothetical protein